MKGLRTITIGVLGLLLLFTVPGIAQNNGHMGGGYYDPDSLTVVTISGVAIADTGYSHPLYFLDQDGDSEADYFLNFGPFWYEPDSGSAQRPENGDTITIEGGLVENGMYDIPVIVVYNINGEFWRDPFEPYWNDFGGHHHGGGHENGCHGYAQSWMLDSLEVISISGTALVDTTFMYAHYYLDENNDSNPEYFLNFGPPWYEPESGAVRPQDGEQISITGALMETAALPVIIVFEINGQTWRDSSSFGPYMGGGWMFSGMDSSMQFHAPYDDEDWLMVHPGWHGGMGHGHGGGGMMPDSIFAQLLELFPENMPEAQSMNGIFAAYEIGMFDANGRNGMWQDGNCGGHMEFNNNAQIQFHYNDIQLLGNNIDENTITVKYWDENTTTWETVTDAQINPENNTITFTSNQVNSFYVLVGEQNITSVVDNEVQTVHNFNIVKNYPNPFNPGTTIQFTLEKPGTVKIRVYNVLGQLVEQLLESDFSSGTHSVYFDASNLPSGIYFVELQAGNDKYYHKIQLIK